MSQLFEKQPSWVADSLLKTLNAPAAPGHCWAPVGDGVGKLAQVISGDHNARVLRVTDGEATVTCHVTPAALDKFMSVGGESAAKYRPTLNELGRNHSLVSLETYIWYAQMRCHNATNASRRLATAAAAATAGPPQNA